ncbi:carboxypeptidase-like regulatory domain-containing protein [uncultured Polaribacter sp.]|uniref:carboxypeptidase-like regulatory domain-containing protein n=1 Tax=uncultured Polaribacter sp. TaxID=174711 RepID=UPI00260ED239|nr:carboxypeptidase-like regulatory domain-containing protein [uncultured Polaribacter sp.]
MKIIKYLIILLLSNSFFIHSQNSNKRYIIIDSNTNEPIPYVAIKFLKTNKGVYSNEKGEFINDEKKDSIQISHLNYSARKIKLSEQSSEIIYLNPKLNVLDEIRIEKNKHKEKTIGFVKKKKNLSWFIKPKTELTTLIKYSKKINNSEIKKIVLPIGKKTLVKNKKLSFNNIFRVNLYSNINNKPGVSLLKKPVIISINQDSKDIIEINVEKFGVNFPVEGVFVAVEMIGKLDINGNVLNETKNILPAFMFTDKKRKNIISSSFIKTVFGNNKWIKIDEYYKNVPDISKYNMAVSLELLVYEK